VTRLAAKQQTGVTPQFCYITAKGPSMARLWPAYVLRHGLFLARLVFANEKACKYVRRCWLFKRNRI